METEGSFLKNMACFLRSLFGAEPDYEPEPESDAGSVSEDKTIMMVEEGERGRQICEEYNRLLRERPEARRHHRGAWSIDCDNEEITTLMNTIYHNRQKGDGWTEREMRKNANEWVRLGLDNYKLFTFPFNSSLDGNEYWGNRVPSKEDVEMKFAGMISDASVEKYHRRSLSPTSDFHDMGITPEEERLREEEYMESRSIQQKERSPRPQGLTRVRSLSPSPTIRTAHKLNPQSTIKKKGKRMTESQIKRFLKETSEELSKYKKNSKSKRKTKAKRKRNTKRKKKKKRSSSRK